MNRHNGATIELHYMIMEWMLEGPPRTKSDMSEQFMLEGHVKHHFDALLRLGLIREGELRPAKTTAPGTRAREFVPVKVLRLVEPPATATEATEI